MKPSRFLLIGAVALMAFAGCSDDVEEPTNQNQNQNNDYDDSYYAKNASISSSDDQFAVTDDGVVISFGASGGEVVVNVDCGTEWTAKNNAEDIFGCSIKSTSVTITAGQNLVGEELTGTITLMTAKRNVEFATITVTQAGQAYITLSPEELSLPNIGSTTTVAVESNYDWDYSYDSSNGWFTVEKNEKNSSLSITYLKNETGSDREGVVTVTAGDGDKTVAEAELKITQSWENLDALILEFTNTENNVHIDLPIYDYANITVDWDDGTTNSSLSHTFSTPGIYTVTINGDIQHIYAQYSYSASTHLTAVKQWGNTGLTSMDKAFYMCYALQSVPEDSSGAFKDVKSFDYAFYKCSSLVSAPSFEGCSHAGSFSECFYGCSSLTNIPENMFSGCTAATTFKDAFYNCSSLVSAPSFEGCSYAGSFSECFYGCSSLTNIPENMFSGCTAARTFEDAFYKCSSLVSAPSFEGCSAATTFSECFRDCSSLTNIPENMFSGCTAATTFYRTFSGSLKLGPTSLPDGLFANCTAVTNFSYCFAACSGLTSIPEGLFDDCTAVTDFGDCFVSCSELTSIPEGLFGNCPSVTSFCGCFDGCSGLTSIHEGLFDNTLCVTDFEDTFRNCSSISGESPYTKIEIDGENVKVHLYERNDYAVNLRWTIPTSYSNCFTGSTFSDIDSIPSKWGGNGK